MAADDTRLKLELGAGRADRSMDDRKVTEDREVTDDDRLEMFRQQLFNDALPDLPDIPGFHVCWLTTTNPRDPIHRRMQLGYQPITSAEAKGLDYATAKTGEWQGFIAVNEMLAFKLPMKLYLAYMDEAHHQAPAREQGKLTDTTDFLRQQAEAKGAKVEAFDGVEDLRNSPARGLF